MWFRFKEIGLTALFLVGIFIAFPGTGQAATWNYAIREADTPSVIDVANTTASVKTDVQEITLPSANAPNLLALAPDGSYEYAVLTTEGVKTFSFDGSQMAENTLLNVPQSNPLALAMPTPYPSVTVADKTSVKQYLFSGSGMVEAPALEIAGLTNIASVGSVDSSTVALLDDKKAKVFQFAGNGMVENTILEPAVPLTNPVSIAIDSQYSLAVLEKEKMRYFNFTGTGIVENPAMEITGLTNPIAFSVDNKEVAIVDGKQVKHFSFDGSSLVYNSVLSVTDSAGITNPKGVVIKPGSYDRIILDGDTVKYFNWDGSGLVFNPALSKQVLNIVNGGGYVTTAQVQSLPVNPGNTIDQVRVRAYHQLPDGTSVEWSVTANGTNWVKRWRVRGVSGGTIAETTDNNGVSWSPIGDESLSNPNINTSELWVGVSPGQAVRWMAELKTFNPEVTPKIIFNNETAIVWETNGKPSPPVLEPVPEWLYTTTPTFKWKFVDSDAEDQQLAYQVVIKRASDGSGVYDTAKVMSSDNSFTLPTSQVPDVPGPLWQANTYSFTVTVRAWDSKGAVSDYCVPKPIKVLAFERPRIAEIVSPPTGQISPVMEDPATHLMITPGMPKESLPNIKAGARVTLILDSVGPVNSKPVEVTSFPHCTETAFIGEASALNPAGSVRNTWTVPFWTSASLKEVPAGTVVTMNVIGTGTEGGTTTFNVPPYADGIVRTEGSIYENWFIILQGSEK